MNPPSVFVVQHLHIHDSGNEDVKMIGVFESRQAAEEEAAGRLISQPDFRDMPNIVNENSRTYLDESGFYINEYKIGDRHWTEGFGTFD